MYIGIAVYLKTREGRRAGVDKAMEEMEPCIPLAEMSNGAAIIKTNKQTNKLVKWTGV